MSDAREYQFFDMVMTVTENDEPSTLRWAEGTVARVVSRAINASGALVYEIEWQQAPYYGYSSAWVTGKDLKPHIDASGVEPPPPGAEAKSRMATFQPVGDTDDGGEVRERHCREAVDDLIRTVITEYVASVVGTDDDEKEDARVDAERETRQSAHYYQ